MSRYELIKNALDEKGELMIKSDAGEKFELHKHNVTCDDTNKIFKIDGSNQIYWIDPEKVSYYWIHKKAKDSDKG